MGLVYTTEGMEQVRGAPTWAQWEPWQHTGREATGLPALDVLLCKIHISTSLQKLAEGTTGYLTNVYRLITNEHSMREKKKGKTCWLQQPQILGIESGLYRYGCASVLV